MPLSVNTAAAALATMLALASCSEVATDSEVGPASVDIASLDVGHYPTTPAPPMGTAGTSQLGAIVEGQRMANYVTGPWEVDPAMTGQFVSSAIVLPTAATLTQVMPEAFATIAARHNFVAGFYTSRDDAGRTLLQNAVLRFPNPPASATAAKEFGEVVESGTDDGEPLTRTSIPGHPEAAGFSGVFDRANPLQPLLVRAFTAHGPYLLVQLAQGSDSSPATIGLIAKTLDRQIPLIDQFTPSDPAKLADLPIDPTGLLARTLPIAANQADASQRTVYDMRGSLQFQTDPTASTALFEGNGMTRQANAATAVYEARDTAGAQGITDGFYAEASSRGTPVESIKQLNGSRCLDLSTVKIALFSCLLTADRYAIEAHSELLLDAQQKASAQYAMLMAP